jgi:hypothetical protein
MKLINVIETDFLNFEFRILLLIFFSLFFGQGWSEFLIFQRLSQDWLIFERNSVRFEETFGEKI